MSGRHSWSLQTTDRLQDRLGDVAGSFKRQQEQQGSQTLKSDEQLSWDPSLFWGVGGGVILLLVCPTRSGGCPAPSAPERCLLNTVVICG